MFKFLILLGLFVIMHSYEVIRASVYLNSDGSFMILENINKNEDYIATAKYSKSLESIGWDLLAIKTNKGFPDDLQASAAGYLEGFLTKERIWNHWRNLNSKTWNNKGIPSNVHEFLYKQEEYIKDMFNKNKDDPIWLNAYLLTKQFDSLVEAYNKFSDKDQIISKIDFHTMSSFGDLFDIIYYNNTEARPKFDLWNTEEIETFFHKNSHCSALFKVKEDFSDIFFGHNSWFYYSALNRIFKEYNFNYNHPSVKSRNILFSSYPATLASIDDFYITSQDLAIIETTNPFFNNDLYEKLNPNSLLCWQRAMISNRISTNSKEWVENFSNYNSGTYNNQFMVLDMKKVDLDKNHIEAEAMYIIEQIPGDYEISDVTEILKYGYWPSYNTPFSRRIMKESKIDTMIEKKPELSHSLDYSTCSRANIFRREQGKISDEQGFKKLIRYNDYLNDPLSLGKPSNAISSRMDLSNNCMGAYDAKMSSVRKAKGKNKKISIIAGPTAEQQPVFNWETSSICKDDPRFGLPSEYNFTWYEYESEYSDEYLYKELTFLE